ncbi:MAG TPA: hypothetical protein VM029_11325 [Opitutaceae bacterium]|nr:hypothetical protein [Opitutaceae bacterium]
MKARRPPSIFRDRRASVLVIVMMSVLFATFALVAFMERASTDLLVDQREVLTRRLRAEAYSALEVTLAVLNEFREATNGLHSPAEGWADPLGFAGYVPTEGRVVQITFEDESGKISLPRANAQVLTNLFKNWQLTQPEAEMLADAMLGWMHKNHVYATSVNPGYDHGPLPFEPPGRSLRTFGELMAIEKVREKFFDDEGRPNDYWRRFVDSVSLLEFQRPNINGARPDALAALGQFDPTQQQNIADYLRGEGGFAANGPQFFQSPAEAAKIAAGAQGDTSGFGATISALRIVVTVIDGRTQFRVAAVIAPPGGATTVQATATSQRAQTSADASKTGTQRQNATNPTSPKQNPAAGQNAPSATATRNLKYPFTLLEIRENDAIPSVLAPPPS